MAINCCCLMDWLKYEAYILLLHMFSGFLVNTIWIVICQDVQNKATKRWRPCIKVSVVLVTGRRGWHWRFSSEDVKNLLIWFTPIHGHSWWDHSCRWGFMLPKNSLKLLRENWQVVTFKSILKRADASEELSIYLKLCESLFFYDGNSMCFVCFS